MVVVAGERLLDRDLEAGDDARVAASREELGIRVTSRHPCIALLRVGDDIRKAPGTDREEPNDVIARVAEGVETGTSFRAEHEVARRQLLRPVLVPEDGATA